MGMTVKPLKVTFVPRIPVLIKACPWVTFLNSFNNSINAAKQTPTIIMMITDGSIAPNIILGVIYASFYLLLLENFIVFDF